MKPIYSRYDKRPSSDFMTPVDDEPIVKQEFKDECDINVIMAKYQDRPPPVAGNPLYGDFSLVEDFHAAQEILLKGRAQFDGMSSDVRDRFGNDPGKFLAFVGNPANKDECRKLGLFRPEDPKPVKAPPMEVIVVSPAGAVSPPVKE